MKSTEAAYSGEMTSHQDNESITTPKNNRSNTTNNTIKQCQPYPTIINYLHSKTMRALQHLRIMDLTQQIKKLNSVNHILL